MPTGRSRSFTSLAALILGASALLLASRAGRPIEHGGDAFSDGYALIAGRNFAERGFSTYRFLPNVRPPRPEDPGDWRDGLYTHNPPLADLTNGALRLAGLRSLAGFRLFAGAVSIAGLVFWLLALRELLDDDATALLGLASYGLCHAFVWLADSVNYHGYVDASRLLLIWLAIRARRERPSPLVVPAIGFLLLVQSLLTVEHVAYSQVVLLGLGVTGFRGARLRNLLVLGAVPVLGFGLHCLQDAWAVGASAAAADLWGAAVERSMHAPVSRLAVLVTVIERVKLYYGLGAGTFAALAAIGIAAAPDEPSRSVRARTLATLALASLPWYVVFAEHTQNQHFSVRELLPAASLAFALGLRGIFDVASARLAPRRALALASLAAGLLALDGRDAYRSESATWDEDTSRFQLARGHASALARDRPLATNIFSVPVLEVILDRRVAWIHGPMHYAKLEGRRVVFLFSRYSGADPALIELLKSGRLIVDDPAGAIVEVDIPARAR